MVWQEAAVQAARVQFHLPSRRRRPARHLHREMPEGQEVDLRDQGALGAQRPRQRVADGHLPVHQRRGPGNLPRLPRGGLRSLPGGGGGGDARPALLLCDDRDARRRQALHTAAGAGQRAVHAGDQAGAPPDPRLHRRGQGRPERHLPQRPAELLAHYRPQHERQVQ